MNFTRIAQEDGESVVGTCLQGYVHTSYQKLVETFGEPVAMDGYKVRVEWGLDFGDIVATIYDWKKTSIPLEHILEWNIGGHDGKAVMKVQEALDALVTVPRWPNGLVY